MGHTDAVAHDPSAPSGHLPGFAREERSEAQSPATICRSATMSAKVRTVSSNSLPKAAPSSADRIEAEVAKARRDTAAPAEPAGSPHGRGDEPPRAFPWARKARSRSPARNHGAMVSAIVGTFGKEACRSASSRPARRADRHLPVARRRRRSPWPHRRSRRPDPAAAGRRRDRERASPRDCPPRAAAARW